MGDAATPTCKICSTGFGSNDHGVNVGTKGLTSLISASQARQERELEDYFRSKLEDGRIVVHKECRKRFTDLWNLEPPDQLTIKRSRSPTGAFNWKEDCLFCGEGCTKPSESKNPSQRTYS